MNEIEIKQKIEALELEKSYAISNQQYDRAAQIRDQIAALTNHLEKLTDKTSH